MTEIRNPKEIRDAPVLRSGVPNEPIIRGTTAEGGKSETSARTSLAWSVFGHPPSLRAMVGTCSRPSIALAKEGRISVIGFRISLVSLVSLASQLERNDPNAHSVKQPV